MEIATDYAVKLFFTNTSFVQVYFEAIANAFDAGATEIQLEVEADGVESPTVSLRISDNGSGFGEADFDRFARLIPPRDKFHKRLGRLVFLQYFEKVEIRSVNGGNLRSFTFSEAFDGTCLTEPAPPGSKTGTTLRFSGFKRARVRSYEDLTPGGLKSRIIEQFLPLLHDKKRREIPFTLSLGLSPTVERPQREFIASTATITSADIPDLISRKFKDESIDLFAEIVMWYSVHVGASRPTQFTAVSVDRRTIPVALLPPKAVPPDCAAVFFFESELFTGNSDSARQRLALPEGVSEQALFRLLRHQVSEVLDEEVPRIAERNKETREQIEASYPHLVGLFEQKTAGLIDRDEVVEHAQTEFFKGQRQVLDAGALNDEVFAASLELSARSLASYILYRDFVIKKLKATPATEIETAIHDLIVPRYHKGSGSELINDIYRNNAWILDDKFMTYRTVLSEARMTEVIAAIGSDEDAVGGRGRPDISMIFSADPDQSEAVDVVVVELKRRKLDDKEGLYAATQLVQRARKLVKFCPNIQRVWYYGVIEIDQDLGETLRSMKWAPLFSKGQVFYNDFQVFKDDQTVVPMPTFLVSYDALTNDAAARNHAFLELLRAGFKGGRGGQ